MIKIFSLALLILFTATGKGTYICDLKGKILAEFGLLNAPVWYNDNFIAGMYDKDDGHKVISSEIVLISVDGKNKYPISTKGEIAMYPSRVCYLLNADRVSKTSSA